MRFIAPLRLSQHKSYSNRQATARTNLTSCMGIGPYIHGCPERTMRLRVRLWGEAKRGCRINYKSSVQVTGCNPHRSR